MLTALVVLASGASAVAHGADSAAIWRFSSWDAAVLAALAAAAALYAVGARRLAARGAIAPRQEAWAFWSGWGALVVAVSPALDRGAAWRFSTHMVQHELLMVVGVPLVVAGRPLARWLWALAPGPRGRSAALLQAAPARALWRAVTQPLVATLLHGATLWAWHLPRLYEAAVADDGVHTLQHATFAGTAAAFWWGIVNGRGGRAAYGVAALYVFATSVHTGVLGAALALAERPFYAVYAARAAAAGVDATVDQQLAGLYMWIPAGAVLTGCGLALVAGWLGTAARRASRGAGGPPATGPRRASPR